MAYTEKAMPVGGLTEEKLALATATAEDVLSGKTFYASNKELKTGKAQIVIDLGTGTSFDVSAYSGFENFTVDNFICEQSESGAASGDTGFRSASWYDNQCRGYGDCSVVLNKSYDSVTGVLTAEVELSGSSTGKTNGGIGDTCSYSDKVPVKAYLVLK